jgi:hypothetical protein
MVARCNLKGFNGDINPMWIMAYVTHFGIDPSLLMGKHFDINVMEHLRQLYASTCHLDTTQQLEDFFHVKFCAIKFKGKRGFSPDDFYYISRRTVFYEVEKNNIWLYIIDAKSLLLTLSKKLKKDIHHPSDYRCDKN